MARPLSPPLSPQVSRQQRPRPTTTASHRSHKSWRSSTSGVKIDLVETARDKRRLTAKSDPTEALREAQPAAIALEDSNLDNLRAVQHKDNDGNVITDPDRSNPTRYRLERPLDTIRSFNAAAEGTSHRRSSYGPRPCFSQDPNGSRRSSYYNSNGYGPPQGRPRPGQGGYYRNGSYGFRPDPHVEDMQQQSIPFGRPPRQPPHHYYENGESPVSGNSYGHSYETMTSGSEDYGKSTNPSSQNSSFDRLHQMQRKPDDNFPQSDDDIQYAPPTPQSMKNSLYGQQNMTYHGQHPQQYSQPNGQYASPPAANNPQQPIKLNTAIGWSEPPNSYKKPLPIQKRQSWIKRTFSRRYS